MVTESNTQEAFAPPTLGAVIDQCRGLVDLLHAPGGMEAAVTRPTIETDATEAAIGPGDLVIAMGVDPYDETGSELVRATGESGGAAIAFRIASDQGQLPQALQDAAAAGGVAILSVAPELGWDQVYAALEAAIAGAGVGSGGSAVRLGDLNALANAVAAMAGGPVTIEDPESQVLAHSSGAEPLDEARRASILDRRTPAEWRKRFEGAGVYRRLWTSDEVVRIDEFAADGLRPRLAVAVRAGEELLGSIWVAEGTEPLGKASEAALTEAARIAAIHLARRRSTAEVERRVRGNLLRSLLDGRGAPDILAERLGISASGPYVVVAFRISGTEATDHPVARDRVLNLVGLAFDSWTEASASVVVGPTIYTLARFGTQDQPESAQAKLLQLTNEVVVRARAGLGVALVAGMATPATTLGEVPTARAEADAVLAAADANEISVATSDDVRATIVMNSLRHQLGSGAGNTGLLAAVSAHDAGSGTDYLETLRAHLDGFGDVGTASTRLGVHPNTFRYRVRRLGELFGIDLDDPDERLALELELTLWPH